MVQKHAPFAPASQKRLDSRLRSPLPSVEEPCPLSLPYGFFTTLPEPFYDVMCDAQKEDFLSQQNQLKKQPIFWLDSYRN